MLMVLTDFSMSVRSPFRLQPHQSRLLKGTSKGALWTIQTPERTLRCAIARIRSGSGASAGHRWPGLQLLGQPKPAVRSIAKPFPGAILRPLAPASPRSLWERREASSAFEVAPDGSGGDGPHLPAARCRRGPALELPLAVFRPTACDRRCLHGGKADPRVVTKVPSDGRQA